MRAVTIQGPRDVRVDDLPEPALTDQGDAIISISATGICGSDLHIYRGVVPVETGFILGHEYVGTVLELGNGVTRFSVGDRVAGCFHTACGSCFHCIRSEYPRCAEARTFGHGSTLGNLPGTQAELALIPHADMVLRVVPEGVGDDVALFAGDVMGTAFHAVTTSQVRVGDVVAVLGLGPIGLCSVQVARLAGATVIAIDSVEERLAMAASFGATAINFEREDARSAAKEMTGGRGVDVAIEAVGDPRVLDTAIRMTRACGNVQMIGAHTKPGEIHLGLAWLKSLTIRGGQANVIGHIDRVMSMLETGQLDPTPIVTHRMALEDAAEAYAIYDRHESLKIVLAT